MLHAALAFEGEGLGHDRHGERAEFAGQRRDDGRGSGAGAASKSGGYEDHVSAFQGFDDLVGIFEGGLAADFGIGARTQAVGELDAELNFYCGVRHAQCLQVGVSYDKFDAFHAGIDHPVYRVVAAATHPDDLDFGIVAGILVEADANAVFSVHVCRHS